VLLENDPRLVYPQAWGGTNTIARALKSIEETYRDAPDWTEIKEYVSSKAVIYTILDQDATYTMYIAPNWPDVKSLYNSAQFWSFAYSWRRVVPDELKPFRGGAWFEEHIKFDHGPLLEAYYAWGDGGQINNDPEHAQGSLERTLELGHMQYNLS